MDNHPISCQSLATHYKIDGKQLERQYKNHLSDYRSWSQLSHADKYLLYPQNIGTHLSLDETSLSNGELYTLLTNKDKKGGKGCIVAIIQGVKSDEIIEVFKKIPLILRKKVKEVTVDMAGNMHRAITHSFKSAEIVVDRFHVQMLANEAIQDLRIKYRWDAIDLENKKIKLARKVGESYKSEILGNGDTIKQLLARSRGLLFKSRNTWSPSQCVRASYLFDLYPDIKAAYDLVHKLRCIYNQNYTKEVGRAKLALWYNEMENMEQILKGSYFSTVINTIKTYSDQILNYFNNRSTNASAESFNAKIKAFRAGFRGVTDIKFFLYRLTKIYA